MNSEIHNDSFGSLREHGSFPEEVSGPVATVRYSGYATDADTVCQGFKEFESEISKQP